MTLSGQKSDALLRLDSTCGRGQRGGGGASGAEARGEEPLQEVGTGQSALAWERRARLGGQAAAGLKVIESAFDPPWTLGERDATACGRAGSP